MTKEGQDCEFHSIRAKGLMLGRGYISQYSEYALSSTLSIYMTLIAIVLKSLSPIHFVKIRLSNFLGNEFLIKMYKL